MNKGSLYKVIKIAGMISFIPGILLVSIIGGYFAGDFLRDKFNLPQYVVLICVGIGFAAAVFETVRIVKKVIRIENKS